ncbi:recombinase family protein [Rhodococcus sp. NPDC127528]|uniref:recombinase family protein n=1 Tax=unclassified Rhodococcus (in: high G+C Gram-positive bacteria) TaxID=192944 RepID=UPI0036366B3A
MTTERLRLVAYLRVSTIEQAKHGYGLDSQRAAIKAAAKSMDARIVSWTVDEGLSGALPATDRPGLTEALTAMRLGEADGLIVRDLDRLARAVTVQEAVLAEVWRKSDASVYTSVPAQEVQRDDPDDPMRTAMREMAAVFAGLERRMTAKRLRDGRRAKADQGGHANGRAPYGWRSAPRTATNPHGALVEVPAEQAALSRMLALASLGCSTREIASVLDSEGHPTKRGGKWSSPTVARILSRATNPRVRSA